MWGKQLGVAGILFVAAAASADQGPCSPEREPPPPPASSPSRVRLEGRKVVAPQLQRSEAGVVWSLGSKLTLELNYQRTALAPLMPHDHEDGIATQLKLGF